MQYEHVHEKFRHLVTADNQERIAFLDEPRWLGYGVAKDIMDNLVSLMNKPKRPRMLNLLIVGDSNNGKTTLIRRFFDLYGQAYIDSDSNAIYPILLAEAPPSANEKELYISLLERFYVPYKPTDTIAKLRYQTIHLFREFRVKMLIIDEFHSLLVGTPRLQRQVMNAIKMLCNELQIPIVGVGTRDAIRVLHTDPQHASRFDVAELPTWKLDKEFQKLLFQFQGILPLRKSSNLQSPELATKIHTISGGNLGNVHRLLTACAVQAITSGTEKITLDIIEKNSWVQPTNGYRKIIGKITRYGAVCNVCSRYFREERECFECGKLSRTMLRAPESGHNELLCLACFRKYRFATCKNCGRYRQVHDRDNQLCRKCSEQHTLQCPKCKQDMPAGYGNVCENCAKRTLLFNLIRMNVHLFRHKAVKRAYKKFIFWYLAKCGVSVVLKKSDDHVLFFMRCDENWADIPDYRELVTFFKPNGLRAHLTVLRWLLDTNQVKVDESLKAEMAELERIQSLFNKLSNSVPCIANYYTQLQHKYEVGKTSLKSVRLALQPAIDFISSESVSLLPTQVQLNSYLVAKTGQIAAITGFINHLNREYHCELEIDRSLIQKMKEKQLKQQAKQRLAILYKQEKLSIKEQNELLSVVLLNLHNIWIKSPKKLSISEIDGIAYYVDNEKKYFIPKDIHIRLME